MDYKLAHSNPRNIRFHFIGTSLFILCGVLAWVFHIFLLLLLGILIAYLLAHFGHKNYEKNKSMRGSHPVFCVLGAGLLYFETWQKLLGFKK